MTVIDEPNTIRNDAVDNGLLVAENRTTEQTAMERFRAELEKRGVEFETNDDECAEGEERMTTFNANLGESEFDILVTAKDWYFDGELTPWLDVEFYNTLTPEQAISATLGSGTLTAEQIREAIEKRFDFDVWVPPERWQAIADELNAELGSGTCKQEERGWSTEGDHARVWLTCGHDCMVPTVADLPNFCPVCGKAVKR